MITKLHNQGCTEEQIVALTATSHRQVRAELKKIGYLSSRLYKSAQKELKFHQRNESLRELATDYHTTVPQVLWAIGQRAEAVNKLVVDFTHLEISEMFGVSRSRITQLAVSAQQEQNHTLTESDWSNITMLYLSGQKTVPQLANEYSVAVSTIYTGLKR